MFYPSSQIEIYAYPALQYLSPFFLNHVPKASTCPIAIYIDTEGLIKFRTDGKAHFAIWNDNSRHPFKISPKQLWIRDSPSTEIGR